LQIGLVGLPLVGKTTFFNLLTGADAETAGYMGATNEVHTGNATVPDERVDFLTKFYRPRRTIHAQIQFKDIPGVQKEAPGAGLGGKFLDEVRGSEVLVHVVRAFSDSDVPHPAGSIDPLRDIDDFNTELILADLELIEKRMERVKKAKKKVARQCAAEMEILARFQEALENERPVSTVKLSDTERQIIAGHSFLTEKPVILAVNLDEEQLAAGVYEGSEKVREYAGKKGFPVIEICAKIEMEISRLPREDRAEFLADMGLKESGIARLARAAYDYLELISFFTVGEDEVKAWTIRKGTNAKKAAGKIHSDMERGFIRAEVFHFSDLYELGSVAKVRERGKFRLEGKDYIVQDGDIINFRFNV